jgi:hypothetical protein
MLVSLALTEHAPPTAGALPPLCSAEHGSAGYAWAIDCSPRYDMPDAKPPNQSPSAGQEYASYGLRLELVHKERSIGEPGQEVVKDW